LLPKTLIDGSSNLNVIFTETLRKMDFNFNKITACDEPFYGVMPGKAAYPIGRVCLPVTFCTQENFRTKYLMFEVADFRSSYHAILGQPMLAKFMAVHHHTYLIIKMLAPNGIIFVLGDIMVSTTARATPLSSPKTLPVKLHQRSWSLRQPRLTKQLWRCQSRSAQSQPWTQAQQ
jgi:hypothetical protein